MSGRRQIAVSVQPKATQRTGLLVTRQPVASFHVGDMDVQGAMSATDLNLYVAVTVIRLFDDKIKRCTGGCEFSGETILRGRILRNDRDFARDPVVHFRCENLKIHIPGMFVVQFQLQGLVNTTRVRDEAAFVTCVGTTVPFRVVNQVGIPLQLRDPRAEKLHAMLDSDEGS